MKEHHYACAGTCFVSKSNVFPRKYPFSFSMLNFIPKKNVSKWTCTKLYENIQNSMKRAYICYDDNGNV